MFSIQGIATFTESDMYIGEKLMETLKNEGFVVKKEYILSNPARLIVNFGVEQENNYKPDGLFSID